MAYTTRMAAALSGATLSQLRHWRSPRTGPLLAPEIKSPPSPLYSFRDVLALRTFVRLRQDASLQRIRRAIGNLRDFGEREHVASYRLVSDNSGNIQAITDKDAFDLVKHPGQRQLLVAMGKVIEPFPVRAGVLVPDLFQPRPHVAIDPGIQGGVPVVAGTRVPYDVVAALIRDGVAPEGIASYYPGVTPEAARDALDFALYVDSYDPARRAALCGSSLTRTPQCRSWIRCGIFSYVIRLITSPACTGRARRTATCYPTRSALAITCSSPGIAASSTILPSVI